MTKARQLADLGNAYDDGALSNRSLIINGAMQVWQRGTSVTGAGSSGYSTADRWQHNASGGSLDLSQQSLALGQTDIPQQIKHFMRISCTTGNNNAGMWQKVEDVTSAQGTVTVSFYAKGTNPNGGVFELNIRQNYGSSGSTEDEQNETFSVTSSWQRFTFTINLTSLSGKTIAGGDDYIWVYFKQPSADTSTNAWTLDFTGVQLEVGDTATPFEHRSYGEELAKCQRYFQVLGNNQSNGAIASGYHHSSSEFRGQMSFLQRMRVPPTGSTSTVSGFILQDTGGNFTSTSIILVVNYTEALLRVAGHQARTAGQGANLLSATGTAIYLDAEL